MGRDTHPRSDMISICLLFEGGGRSYTSSDLKETFSSNRANSVLQEKSTLRYSYTRGANFVLVEWSNLKTKARVLALCGGSIAMIK